MALISSGWEKSRAVAKISDEPEFAVGRPVVTAPFELPQAIAMQRLKAESSVPFWDSIRSDGEALDD